MTNLFQQQAEADIAAARKPVPSLEECQKRALELRDWLLWHEKRHAGMAAANLEEAAGFATDISLDIGGAIRINKGELT